MYVFYTAGTLEFPHCWGTFFFFKHAPHLANNIFPLYFLYREDLFNSSQRLPRRSITVMWSALRASHIKRTDFSSIYSLARFNAAISRPSMYKLALASMEGGRCCSPPARGWIYIQPKWHLWRWWLLIYSSGGELARILVCAETSSSLRRRERVSRGGKKGKKNKKIAGSICVL